VAFELEVVGYTISLAYCLHKGLPFSAYGELAFLLIQGTFMPSYIFAFNLRVSRTVDVLFCLYNWSWLGLGFPTEHLINALIMLNYQPKNGFVSCDLEGEIGGGIKKHGPEKGKKKKKKKNREKVKA
jgi:hypothetical protein